MCYLFMYQRQYVLRDTTPMNPRRPPPFVPPVKTIKVHKILTQNTSALEPQLTKSHTLIFFLGTSLIGNPDHTHG